MVKFLVQMNTHTHKDNPNENGLCIVDLTYWLKVQMRTHTHYTQSQIDPFCELQILFIVSCLNVYPYTTIGSMEMFYELQTLENGFHIQ
jgi:hypothetical protein